MLPGVAEAANRLAETNGEIDYRLEPLRVHGREMIAVRQDQLRVAKDSGEGIIDFVAEDRAEIGIRRAPRQSEHGRGHVHPTQAALGKTHYERNEVGDPRDEFHLASRHEASCLELSLGRRDQNHGRGGRELAKQTVERLMPGKIGIEHDHSGSEAADEFAEAEEVRDNDRTPRRREALHFTAKVLRENLIGDTEQRTVVRESHHFAGGAVHEGHVL
jgi:hypothetical protein